MNQKYDYELTEDGGLEMCEWWYQHFNGCRHQAIRWHMNWLADLQYSREESEVLENIRKVRWARAEIIWFEKQMHWWFEAGMKYGMLPF